MEAHATELDEQVVLGSSGGLGLRAVVYSRVSTDAQSLEPGLRQPSSLRTPDTRESMTCESRTESLETRGASPSGLDIFCVAYEDISGIYGLYVVITMTQLLGYASSAEAAGLLGAKQVTVAQLCQHGKLSAVKIANRWLIPRDALEDFAKDYTPRKGRPRTKRKYTKRSPKWFR